MSQQTDATEPGLDFNEEESASAVEFSGEEDVTDDAGLGDIGQAVLWASDWTTETIISQMQRGNIEINPRFQRRDAWNRRQKSRFIESLVLGLPIPQIVLAERKNARGQYIVLDGKQRLLSLYHFSGNGEGRDVAFNLQGLEIRKDLAKCSFKFLKERPDNKVDFDTFSNQVIRAVVIRNWPSTLFLHLVFLRLNTGSLKLSAQELRQAIVPGPFSDFADDFTLTCAPLHRLLGRQSPDPRMRDVELFVRHSALSRRIVDYRGRMKEFLDESCIDFNQSWEDVKESIRSDAKNFQSGIESLEVILGENLARKLGSRLFNRSIFDALIFYASKEEIRENMLKKREAVQDAYKKIVNNEEFKQAIESDTAGIPHTVARLRLWGLELSHALDMKFVVPSQVPNQNQINFE